MSHVLEEWGDVTGGGAGESATISAVTGILPIFLAETAGSGSCSSQPGRHRGLFGREEQGKGKQENRNIF